MNGKGQQNKRISLWWFLEWMEWTEWGNCWNGMDHRPGNNKNISISGLNEIYELIHKIHNNERENKSPRTFQIFLPTILWWFSLDWWVWFFLHITKFIFIYLKWRRIFAVLRYYVGVHDFKILKYSSLFKDSISL